MSVECTAAITSCNHEQRLCCYGRRCSSQLSLAVPLHSAPIKAQGSCGLVANCHSVLQGLVNRRMASSCHQKAHFMFDVLTWARWLCSASTQDASNDASYHAAYRASIVVVVVLMVVMIMVMIIIIMI